VVARDGDPPAGGRQIDTAIVLAEVEQALGPGVEFEHDPRVGLVGRRARTLTAWPGLDRAAVIDSDDGLGRRLPILVAAPSSTFNGARLAVELAGGWRERGRTTLLGRIAGTALPPPDLARIAAGVAPDASWIDVDEATRVAHEAGRHYRERRAHARIMGGRAWQPAGALPPPQARFATPHSRSEYRLSTLPPRFLRALEGLLDDDERVLYWIERPMAVDVPLVRRLRGDIDRRAALIALTDRQLLWLVDHARPDRYLSDWGVDVELIPVERIRDVESEIRDDQVQLRVATSAGIRMHRLPAELEAEVGVLRALLAAFTPGASRDLPLRRYEVTSITFDAEPAERFGQGREASRAYEATVAVGEVLAALYSPVRPGQRQPAMLLLRPAAAQLAEIATTRGSHAGGRRSNGHHAPTLAVADVEAIRLTLSPMAGEIAIDPGIRIRYPAPMSDHAAALVRLARRVVANSG
jgi:hypothetical protein